MKLSGQLRVPAVLSLEEKLQTCDGRLGGRNSQSVLGCGEQNDIYHCKELYHWQKIENNVILEIFK
jgi:hypothetical protein